MNSSAIEGGRCNCAALRKASRRLSQLYDAALLPSSLKSTQYAMLVEIDRRASAPPTIGDLADAMVMDQSTFGQNLRPLEREGLVSLEHDPDDRRRRQVKLTRKGKARLTVAAPLWSEAQARFEETFGKQNATDLRAMLFDIARTTALNGDEATTPPS